MIDFSLSTGDFLDRLSIARIKKAKGRLQNTDDFEFALDTLDFEKFGGLFARLTQINTDLWHVEDEIRDNLSPPLNNKNYDSDIDEVREVYFLSLKIVELNDARARVKKEIDLLAGDTPDAKVYAGKVGYDI